MTRRKLSLLAGLVLFACASLLVAGQARAANAEIGIRVIYAVKAKVHSVDPALRDIESELMELPFSKFRLLDRLNASVKLHGTVELEFPGRRTIGVRFDGVDASKGKKMVSLQVSIGPAAKIALRVADGGRTFFIGPSHLEGKLIVDISAKLKEN